MLTTHNIKSSFYFLFPYLFVSLAFPSPSLPFPPKPSITPPYLVFLTPFSQVWCSTTGQAQAVMLCLSLRASWPVKVWGLSSPAPSNSWQPTRMAYTTVMLAGSETKLSGLLHWHCFTFYNFRTD